MSEYEKKSMGERICENRGYYIPADNKKRQIVKDKQMQKKLKKIKINKMQTMIISICVLIAVVFLVLVILKVTNSSNVKITEKNISKVDITKNAIEIVNMYNRDGEEQLFLTEMNRIQNIVATYLISNMTTESDSKSKLINVIRSELTSDNWNNILSNKSTYYRGIYLIDDNGNVKFKFGTKDIEPKWILNDSVSKYIELN